MTIDNANTELLNIFREEAKELLDSITLELQKWSTNLQDKTIFANLKRDLHTLKGGARMVNQPDLSTLAHETESICEALLSGHLEASREAYDHVFDNQQKMLKLVEALASEDPKREEKISELPVESTSEFIRIKSELLEKLNQLSVENNVLSVNLAHYMEQFNHEITDINAIIKALTEKDPEKALADLIRANKELSQTHGKMEGLLLQQSQIEKDIEASLIKARMISFNSIVPRLSRITHQIAEELGKKIDFSVLAAEGEIDRTVLDHITPSLEHLLRNALDHGIELSSDRRLAHKPEIGKIVLRFFREGQDACIEIRDDGAGIHLEKVYKKAVQQGLLTDGQKVTDEALIHCILEPGFSTADAITEISGRGVGMDVVNTVIKGLGGHLLIESKTGLGTTFTIRLPFTTSINRALQVVVLEKPFGLLLSSIHNIILVKKSVLGDLFKKKDPLFIYNDVTYDLGYLGNRLGLSEKIDLTTLPENIPVLLFHFLDHPMALVVDKLLGSQEVVVQTLGPQFKLTDIFSGGSLLSDGSILLVLDPYIMTTKMLETKSHQGITQSIPAVLVVDDSVTIRTVTKNFLEKHGFRVITAKNGSEALNKLKTITPQIILLDVEMPVMNGFEFAEKIKHDPSYVNIPIVMITFSVTEEHQQKAIALGIQKFMSKPYHETELLDIIHHLLGKTA